MLNVGWWELFKVVETDEPFEEIMEELNRDALNRFCCFCLKAAVARFIGSVWILDMALVVKWVEVEVNELFYVHVSWVDEYDCWELVSSFFWYSLSESSSPRLVLDSTFLSLSWVTVFKLFEEKRRRNVVQVGLVVVIVAGVWIAMITTVGRQI